MEAFWARRAPHHSGVKDVPRRCPVLVRSFSDLPVKTIAVRKLVKFYGKSQALDGVDMEVAEGESLGFIGPNGAGKTTTIRTLLGLLRKNTGTADIFGKDVWVHAAELHRSMAYVPDVVNQVT